MASRRPAELAVGSHTFISSPDLSLYLTYYTSTLLIDRIEISNRQFNIFLKLVASSFSSSSSTTTRPSQWLFYFCVISVEPHIGPWVVTEQWSLNSSDFIYLFFLIQFENPFWSAKCVSLILLKSVFIRSDRSRNLTSRATWTPELETINRDKPEARERNTSVILFEKVTKVLFWRFYTIYRQLIKWPSSQPSINPSPATHSKSV